MCSLSAYICICVVHIGIQLLTAELERLIKLSKLDLGVLNMLLEVVNDISASCTISINILNDLLLIDKIDEGNLNLDLKPENARDLIEPCIKNFDVQVSTALVGVGQSLITAFLFRVTCLLLRYWVYESCRRHSPTLISPLICKH